MRALSNSVPSARRSGGRLAIHSRCLALKTTPPIGRRPCGLAYAAGSSFSSLSAVPENMPRTRAFWAVISSAVAWAIGSRRPWRADLWLK